MRIRDVMDLVRIPNVTTAVSDILCAWILVEHTTEATLPGWPVLLWTSLASACLYSGGMALNDVADATRDAFERPERPIPSGRISRATGMSIALVLLGLGVFFAWLGSAKGMYVSLVLVGAIVAYDLALAGKRLIGPVGMASCRALNLLLGLVAAGTIGWAGGLAIGVMAGYVFCVTNLSLSEVEGGGRRSIIVASLALLLGILVLVLFARVQSGPREPAEQAALWVCIVGLAWPSALRLVRAYRAPAGPRIGAAVGAMVSAILWLDASWAMAVADALWLAPFFALGVFQLFLRRSFPVT